VLKNKLHTPHTYFFTICPFFEIIKEKGRSSYFTNLHRSRGYWTWPSLFTFQYSDDSSNCALPGTDVVLSCRIPTFRKKLLPPGLMSIIKMCTSKMWCHLNECTLSQSPIPQSWHLPLNLRKSSHSLAQLFCYVLTLKSLNIYNIFHVVIHRCKKK
jgi:hypothetical protein